MPYPFNIIVLCVVVIGVTLICIRTLKKPQKQKGVQPPEECAQVIGRMYWPVHENMKAILYCHIFFIIMPSEEKASIQVVKREIFYRYKPGDTIPISLL
jgi:hypothetical protein